MSNIFFPVLDGQGKAIPWVVESRKAQWSTQVQRGQGGSEFRVGMWAAPRWKWSVKLPLLRDDAQLAAFKTLAGFFMDRGGMQDSFLFSPMEDAYQIGKAQAGGWCRLTGVQIGVGDGTQKVFPLVRPYGVQTYPYGRAAEPVQWVDTRGAPYGNFPPVFKVNGSTVSATYNTWDGATGGVLATFATAPGAGLAVTADFEFAYRVRLAADEFSAKWFAWAMFEGDGIELEQVLE
jgi:uncharacterized protein (TIGR02217 family)